LINQQELQILKVKCSNGYYGCLKCLQVGVTENHVHLYKFDEANPYGPLRNKDSYQKDSENQLDGIYGKLD
jgi:hypothetical protein